MSKNKELDLLKNNNKKKANYHWIIKVTLISFTLSFCFSFISETVLPNVTLLLSLLVVLLFIFIGIIFDIIGTAVTAADEEPFHSMNAKKMKGANVAVKFKKNAPKLASFCNDVVGDVCGIVSGSAGVILAANLSESIQTDIFVTTLVVTALIASLTIGGKALGKDMAVNNGNKILYRFAQIVSFFYNPKR